MWERVRGQFDEPMAAERAAAALADHGAWPRDIEVARGPSRRGDWLRRWITHTTLEDAWLGARSGFLAGLVMGVLAALAVLVYPGIGRAFGSGTIPLLIGSILQAAVGGAIVGGAVGSLMDVGGTAAAATGKPSGEPVTVTVLLAGGMGLAAQDAVGILRKYGARSVATEPIPTRLTAPSPSPLPWLDRLLPVGTATSNGPPSFRPWVLEVAASRDALSILREPRVVEEIHLREGSDSDTVIPVMAEEMRVERHPMRAGGVRVRKSVDTTWHLVEQQLQREDVELERVPIDRPVAAVPPTRLEGDVVVVPVVEEVLVVEKRLVLKEELRIHRRRGSYTSRHEVPLRHEVASVEALAGEDVHLEGAEQPGTRSYEVEAPRDL